MRRRVPGSIGQAPTGFRCFVPADGVAPCPDLCGASRSRDRNHPLARGARLPGARGGSGRQQHCRRGALGASRGVLRRQRPSQVRARRTLAGVQGRSAQPGARVVHRRARRGRRCGRCRLPGPSRVSAAHRRVLLRRRRRLRPDAPGLPRVGGEPLLHRVPRCIPVLLRGLDALAGPAELDHLRWHDGPRPSQRPRADRGLERAVYHGGC